MFLFLLPFLSQSDLDNDKDTEDDEEVSGAEYGAQHVLILIDCCPTMFQPCVVVVQSQSQSQSQSQNNDNVEQQNTPQLTISPFDAALRAVAQLLKLRVKYVATSKTGKRDGVGVMLFGTKRRKDTTAYGGTTSTYPLIPMEPPGIQQVLDIQKCLPKDTIRDVSTSSCNNKGRSPLFYFSTETPSSSLSTAANTRQRDLQQEFEDQDNENQQPSDVAASMGHNTLCTLRSALTQANKAFQDAKCVKKETASYKGPPDTKAIWIFTNTDDPCNGNEEEKKQVEIITKDVIANGVEIQVWPLPKASSSMSFDFDRNLFYNRITTEDEQVDEMPQYALEKSKRFVNLNDFLSQVNQQWKKRRPSMHGISMLLPGCTSDQNAIALDLYRLVQAQKKPTAVSVHQRTNT